MRNNHYIRCDLTRSHRLTGGDSEYVVYYKTPTSEGHERFTGYKARSQATTFAVTKLQEMSLDNP